MKELPKKVSAEDYKQEIIMKLSTGDIIVHSTLGLMLLTEEIPEGSGSNRLLSLRGRPLFRMKSLLSDGDNQWILYEESVKKSGRVRFATDKDIIDGLTELIERDSIDDKIKVSFFSKDRALAIYDDSENWIWFDEEAIKKLKALLLNVNV